MINLLKCTLIAACLFAIIASCAQQQSKQSKVVAPAATMQDTTVAGPVVITKDNLDSLRAKGYLKTLKPLLPLTFIGTMHGVYRYVAFAGDERNERLLKLYKKNGMQKITTMMVFSNAAGDTVYHFPINNRNFNYNNFPKTSIQNVAFQARLYEDKNLGSCIFIEKYAILKPR